jgi:hypothetical protein
MEHGLELARKAGKSRGRDIAVVRRILRRRVTLEEGVTGIKIDG